MMFRRIAACKQAEGAQLGFIQIPCKLVRIVMCMWIHILPRSKQAALGMCTTTASLKAALRSLHSGEWWLKLCCPSVMRSGLQMDQCNKTGITRPICSHSGEARSCSRKAGYQYVNRQTAAYGTALNSQHKSCLASPRATKSTA